MIEEQIRALNEEGCTRDEIAAQLSLNPAVIDYILDRGIGQVPEDRKEKMISIIENIAYASSDESLKLKAAIYAHEFDTGQRAPKVMVPQINVIQFNQMMANAHNDVLRFVSKSNSGGDRPAISAQDTNRSTICEAQSNNEPVQSSSE